MYVGVTQPQSPQTALKMLCIGCVLVNSDLYWLEYLTLPIYQSITGFYCRRMAGFRLVLVLPNYRTSPVSAVDGWQYRQRVPLGACLLVLKPTRQTYPSRSRISVRSPSHRPLRTSKSFQFLVDASEFHISVHADRSNQEDKDCYEEFLAIVNEYIKGNSNSEINIDSRTKKQILRFEGPSSYASLDMVRRGRRS